ncbi:MAG TPA: response regulator transcription factor [Ktedonobacteraceae bacterium]|nr:response regulator transcription factor [Ktedonobacteraceae bacterium]
MEQKILIAEPRQVIRTGLRTILEQDEQIKDIYEALTSDDMGRQLHSYNIDLTIVNQSLVTEFSLLPMNKFILLFDEPDIDMFLRAYNHKVRGYLSIHISSELLSASIHTLKDTCLLDPVFLPWMMEHISDYIKNAHEFSHLSRREWEITQLMKSGLDRKTIAQQLYISEATLKTHIKNIARKQEAVQWEARQSQN